MNEYRTLEWVNGEAVVRDMTQEEIAAIAPPVPDPEQAKDARIAELKQLLAETDYVALSDYDKDKPGVLAQRQAWRDEIRELEA